MAVVVTATTELAPRYQPHCRLDQNIFIASCGSSAALAA